jgi:glycosyltransferase involved in cell wall biosynthesis
VKVLFVARRYWPAVGGVESFIRELASELAQRHQVTVLAQRVDDGPSTRLTDSLRPPPSFDPFEDGGVRIEPLRASIPRRALMAPLIAHVVPGLRRYAYGRSRVAAAALYARALAPVIATRAREADVMHVWGSDLLAAAAVRAARLAGTRAAITPFAHEGQWGDDPASAAAYRAADRVIGLLDADADVYRTLGVPDEQLAVCGVCSPGVAVGHGDRLRAKLGITGPLVLFLGVRREYKGLDALLEAAPLVGAARSGVTFAFVGPGPSLRNGTDPARILDVGAVSDEERSAWLDAADLLCLPSAGEIFPVSILEAWSVGTPVLVSDVPTLKELVAKSHGGAAVSRTPSALADAIVSLLSDSERLRAMGEQGREFWAAQHTVSAVASWHEGLYAELAGKELAPPVAVGGA